MFEQRSVNVAYGDAGIKNKFFLLLLTRPLTHFAFMGVSVSEIEASGATALLTYFNIQQKSRAVLQELTSDMKRSKLRAFSEPETAKLYSLCAEIVELIFKIEFGFELPENGHWLKQLLETHRSRFSGPIFEERFLRDLLFDLVPILHYGEAEADVHEHMCSNTLDEKREFLQDLIECLIKGLPATGEIELKTYELKRYQKSRVTLDPEDRLVLDDSEGPFTISQACVFKVNRLNVLCGFFSDDRRWHSEKYVPTAELHRIATKYGFTRRKLDSD